MKTFYILCGLPGSGKSTYAKKLVSENRNTICISGDNIRTMLSCEYVFDNNLEPLVHDIISDAVDRAIKYNRNIILDESLFSSKIKERKHWIDIAYFYDYTPKIVYLKTPTRVCVHRRLQDPKGLDENIWFEVINRHSNLFEEPTNKECKLIVIGNNKYE